jgi:hypothetical protein
LQLTECWVETIGRGAIGRLSRSYRHVEDAGAQREHEQEQEEDD